MDPKYLDQFHLRYHGTYEDEEKLEHFLKPPLHMYGIPESNKKIYHKGIYI